MFGGLVDGGPLTEGPHPCTAMTWLTDTVTLLVEADGRHHVVAGYQTAPDGGAAVEYGWVWGVWLWGPSLAAARLGGMTGASSE